MTRDEIHEDAQSEIDSLKDDIAGFESENEELRARIDELLSEVPEDEE